MRARAFPLFLFLALAAAGCQTPVLHGLSEQDSARTLAVLQEQGIMASKEPDNPEAGTWKVMVPRRDVVRVWSVLQQYRLPSSPGRRFQDVFGKNKPWWLLSRNGPSSWRRSRARSANAGERPGRGGRPRARGHPRARLLWPDRAREQGLGHDRVHPRRLGAAAAAPGRGAEAGGERRRRPQGREREHRDEAGRSSCARSGLRLRGLRADRGRGALPRDPEDPHRRLRARSPGPRGLALLEWPGDERAALPAPGRPAPAAALPKPPKPAA